MLTKEEKILAEGVLQFFNEGLSTDEALIAAKVPKERRKEVVEYINMNLKK